MAIDQLHSTCVQFRKYGSTFIVVGRLSARRTSTPIRLIIKHTLSTVYSDKKLKEFGGKKNALLKNSASLDESTKIYALIYKVLHSKENCVSVQSSLTSLFRTE